MAKDKEDKAQEEKPLTEPKLLREIETTRQICVVRHAADGRLVTGGCDALVRVWDLSQQGEEEPAEPKEVAQLAGHHGWVQTIEFAPDRETLFTADSWGQLAAWSLADGKSEKLWALEQAHDGWIRGLAVSADGKLVATCGNDLKVRVHHAADGKPVAEFSGHDQEVFCVAIHPSNKSVVSGDLFGNMKEWSLKTGECLREKQLTDMHIYERIQDVGGLRILKFHDDGNTLICAGQRPTSPGRSIGKPTAYFLDWKTWEIADTFTTDVDNDGFIFDITWHPAGFFVMITSGQPGAGRFMFVRRGEKEPFFNYTKMSNCHSCSLHPDGRKVVASATNRSSQGNGAVKDKEGNYLGNYSPIYEFELPDYSNPA